MDRLNRMGVPATKGDRFGLTRVIFAHPCGIPHELVENPDDTRPAIVNEAQGARPRNAIRGIYGGGIAVMDVAVDGGIPGQRHAASAAKAATPRAACGSCRTTSACIRWSN